MPLTQTELMMHSTVRIECTNASGSGSSGTGFFYRMFVSGDQNVPVIMTNKHVLNQNAKATFVITIAKPDGSPDLGNFERVEINDLPMKWIGHPDENVDLAILPCAEILRALEIKGIRPFLVFIENSIIPTDANLQSLTPVEDVLVVGYPDGIWDSRNNAPVFRRGITATAPYLNFNGKKEFLVDCSIFPGSSGSPVFLYNPGTWATRDGNTSIGTRLYFLGIVFAVALHTVTGQLVIEQAPTAVQSVPRSAIPNNLGLCVMSSRALEFEPLLIRMGLFVPPPGYTMRATIP